jgi:hypothetical protein
MTTPACLAELKDENILAKLPAGYKIGFQQKNNDMLISEMVPVNQSVKNWTEMVTVQVFYALKATPDQFKAQMEKERAVACPGSESHPSVRGARTAIHPCVAAELPPQQGNEQARNHLVQGDRGQ